MSTETLWLTMLGMGAITYAIRLSFVLLWERVSLPAILQRGLRFVPPAVLSAIIFPEMLSHEGTLNLSLGNARLVAGTLAALVAWRTRSAVLTIIVGMATLWALQAAIPR